MVDSCSSRARRPEAVNKAQASSAFRTAEVKRIYLNGVPEKDALQLLSNGATTSEWVYWL